MSQIVIMCTWKIGFSEVRQRTPPEDAAFLEKSGFLESINLISMRFGSESELIQNCQNQKRIFIPLPSKPEQLNLPAGGRRLLILTAKQIVFGGLVYRLVSVAFGDGLLGEPQSSSVQGRHRWDH